MNRKNQKITTYFVILSLLVIGVVYAILQANLQINGIAKIKSNSWDIHFNNVQINENSVSIGTGDSAATIDPENNCKLDFEVTLSLPGDFYEFTVDVVNSGTIDAMIGELNKTLKVNNEVVSEIPSYLNYAVTYDGGDEILPNHLLEAGKTLTYKVRLEFKSDIEELPDATTISTSLEPQYIQADDTAIKKPPNYPCTFDGEMVQGAEYTNGQYTYRYMQEGNASYNSTINDYVFSWNNINSDGWGVILTDATSTDPVTSRLCTSINNKPIVSTSYMFLNSQTTSIDTSSFDTSNVTNMSGMFMSNSALTKIEVSTFNTTNVTNMTSMFNGCSNITILDLTNFNTSNVTNMSSLLAECSNLTTLDLTNFNTSNVTNMYGMFYKCSKLTTLDLNNFNTSNVTDMSAMFNNCSSLTSLDLHYFNTSKVTNMGGMLANCSSLEELNMSGFDFRKLSSPFDASLMANIANGRFSKLKTLNMSNSILQQNCNYAFGGLNTVKTIILDNVNTVNVTNMESMFINCSNLTSLDLSSFNTSNVTSMESMFNGCSKLTILDLSYFNTSKVTSMSAMVHYCDNLEELNLSGFDFSKYNANGLMMDISGGGFSRLKTLNMSNSILPQNCYFAFGRMSTVQTLILDNVNTTNVTNMQAMFMNCSSLTILDLSSFNTSNVTDTSVMFSGCTALTTGYARNQTEADKFNASSNKPSGVTFVVKT